MHNYYLKMDSVNIEYWNAKHYNTALLLYYYIYTIIGIDYIYIW